MPQAERAASNLNPAEPAHGLVQGLCSGKNWIDGPVRGSEGPVILRTSLNQFEPEWTCRLYIDRDVDTVNFNLILNFLP